jgi:DNA-binding transcriptional MocR family regulator
MDIPSLFSRRSRNLAPSPIRKLVPLMRLPGMISFGGGYPHDRTFAFSSLAGSFKSGRAFQVLDSEMSLACQYGATDGLAELKALIASWHAHKDGVTLKNEEFAVLNGAQEGLHIMAYLFLNEEDWVALPEPAYPGAIGAFKAFTDRFLPLPTDAAGVITEKLEEVLRQRKEGGLPLPKFIYIVPNGDNPSGATLPQARRRHLLDIADRFGVLILEDDPYQLLQLDETPLLPTLQSLDRHQSVIRLDSFSKIFAPGLRLGYVSGPREVISAFQLYKQGTNLHASTMSQILLLKFLASHPPDLFASLIRANCAFYRENRDIFVAAVRKYLPAEVEFTIPRAGLFVWFTLPAGYDCGEMVETFGRELGILLVPGGAFSTCGGLKNCLRASFSMVAPEEIEEGMKRLGEMISRARP